MAYKWISVFDKSSIQENTDPNNFSEDFLAKLLSLLKLSKSERLRDRWHRLSKKVWFSLVKYYSSKPELQVPLNKKRVIIQILEFLQSRIQAQDCNESLIKEGGMWLLVLYQLVVLLIQS